MKSFVVLKDELLNGKKIDAENDESYQMIDDMVMSFGANFPDEEAYALIDIIPMIPDLMESLSDVVLDMPMLSPSWPFGDILLLHASPNSDLEMLKKFSLTDGGNITKSPAFAKVPSYIDKSVLQHYQQIDFTLLSEPEWKFILLLLGEQHVSSEIVDYVAMKISAQKINLQTLSTTQEKGLRKLQHN